MALLAALAERVIAPGRLGQHGNGFVLFVPLYQRGIPGARPLRVDRPSLTSPRPRMRMTGWWHRTPEEASVAE
jgi:hypothetical protein